MKKSIILLTAIFFVAIGTKSQSLPQVKIETEIGKIVVAVDTIHAPLTAKNFLYHVSAGTYSNTVFYRVVRKDNQPNKNVKIEVIQGGVFSEERLKDIRPIKHESTEVTGLKHVNGTISMARNEPGSASTEFFICIGNQPELDYGGKRNPDGQGFAAFGNVVKGMDVVKKIQQQKDKNQLLIQPVSIKNMSVIN